MCKITAPEDEPQRGTVIQTDPSGKIETVKDDQGLNRIVSREEFMNRPENQPMQRPDNQSGMLQQYSDKEAAVMDMMSQVPRQAFGVPMGGDPAPRDMDQMTANYNAAFGGINPNLNFIAPRRFTPRPKEMDQFDEARMLQAGIPQLANMPSLDPGEAAAQMALDIGPKLAPDMMDNARDRMERYEREAQSTDAMSGPPQMIKAGGWVRAKSSYSRRRP